MKKVTLSYINLFFPVIIVGELNKVVWEQFFPCYFTFLYSALKLIEYWFEKYGYYKKFIKKQNL